jgi:hypothetical protein
MDAVLDQFHPAYTPQPMSIKLILLLFPHLRPCTKVVSLLRVCRSNFYLHYFSLHITNLVHLILLNFISSMMLRERYKSRNFSLVFSSSSSYFFSSGSICFSLHSVCKYSLYIYRTFIVRQRTGKHRATEYTHATIELRMLLLVARQQSTPMKSLAGNYVTGFLWVCAVTIARQRLAKQTVNNGATVFRGVRAEELS